MSKTYNVFSSILFNHQPPRRDHVHHQHFLPLVIVHALKQLEKDLPRGWNASLLDLVGTNKRIDIKWHKHRHRHKVIIIANYTIVRSVNEMKQIDTQISGKKQLCFRVTLKFGAKGLSGSGFDNSETLLLSMPLRLPRSALPRPKAGLAWLPEIPAKPVEWGVFGWKSDSWIFVQS